MNGKIRHRHRAGLLRREVLQVGILGALGVAGGPLYATPEGARRGTAKNVILVWLPGGPPQMQLWDLKPDSPAECRGSARPIRTSAPGILLGHWLPETARVAHHLALVRTVTLGAEDDNHNLGHHKVLSAIDFKPAGTGDFASPRDWPGMGAVAGAFCPSSSGLPSSVILPFQVTERSQPLPGQLAGWMGAKHDPWSIEQDPSRPDFHVPDLAPLPGFAVERVTHRRQLLAAVDGYRRDLDRELTVRRLHDTQQRAFGVITSPVTRAAFDLAREPAKLREAYGLPDGPVDHPRLKSFGPSLLLARRLVEAGVRFVQVNLGDENFWDFHQREDELLRARMPAFDRGFSALLRDLEDRGLLRETLVLCLGEMGRNPRLGAPTAGGTPGIPDGRNHWQWCWTALFAGGGVRGGIAIGESDEFAGHPNGEAYYPSAIGATVFAALGIPRDAEVRDLQDRPIAVNTGEPIPGLR